MTPPKLIISPNLIIVHVIDFDRLLVAFLDLGEIDIAEVDQVSLGQEDFIVQNELDLTALAQFLLRNLLEFLLAFAQQILNSELISLQTVDDNDGFHHFHKAFEYQFLEQSRVVIAVRSALLQQTDLCFVQQLNESFVSGD